VFLKKRVYGSTKEISLEKLKETFNKKELSYIKYAVLFGSRASNNSSTPQSDYDIAILTDPNQNYDWGVLAKAYNDIGKLLELKEYDYDIVDLATANKLIKNNIKKNFKLLKGDVDGLQTILDRD
jgi:predicted nucleotidyltransferase